MRIPDHGPEASYSEVKQREPVEKAVASAGDRPKQRPETAKQQPNFSGRQLKFEYQKEANVFQISVFEGEGEIIRKIPPDAMLRLIEGIERVIGLTFDTIA